MDLTYQEKRIWISLTTQLLCYGFYYIELHRGAMSIAWLVHVVLAVIILQVILQAILSLIARREPKDERDLAIERVAYRNAYFVLVAAIIAAMAMLAAHAFHSSDGHNFHLGPFHVLNVLLFVLLLAEITKLASQLVLYRRAA